MTPRGPAGAPDRRPRALVVTAVLVLAFAGCQHSSRGAPIRIGLSVPLTGVAQDLADTVIKGAQLAVEEVNRRGGAAGHLLTLLVLNSSATAEASPLDPTRSAANYRQLVRDHAVVAVLGPLVSEEARVVVPIAGEADLATVSPSVTDPELSDPAQGARFRPRGWPVFFRNVASDRYQGPAMADFAHDTAKVSRVALVDDGGVLGVEVVDRFRERATALGMTVLGRIRVESEAAAGTLVPRVAALSPDAVYYGGQLTGGVALAGAINRLMPGIVRLSGDGLYRPAFPAREHGTLAEGWYVSSGVPDLLQGPAGEAWVRRFVGRFQRQPTNYAVTAYSVVLVIADAVERVARSGKTVERSAVRAAIAATSLDTPQGHVAYDADGDLQSHVISVYQIRAGRFVLVANLSPK